MRKMLLFACVVLSLAVGRRSALAADNQPPKSDPLAAQATAILKTYCHRCHGVEFKQPGLDMLDRATLLRPKDSSEKPYLVPKDLKQSRIWDAIDGGDMPPAKQPQPSAADKATIKKWIEAGAEFPAADRPKREFLGEDSLLKVIASDLERQPATTRRYLRYFSLGHLWNDPNLSDLDLRHVRAGVGKLLNSLSWKPRIAVPRAVDADATMLAIDLRDIGWTERHWSYVLEAPYPYGLQRGDEIAKRVYELTDCALPYLRADWFVNQAARPPLYHQLLALPEHVATLEHQLGVDRKLNFDKDTLHRAGFRKSGVSGQNRVVERHDAKHGAYWISDDFLNQTDRGDIFRFPLGPEFPGTKSLSAYKHDGGEIIFNLPNGLQAYLLAKSSGERINEGPVKIVNDPNQFGGTFEIVNGISCMGCHRHGMIPFEDTVRATFNKQSGQAVADKVQRLYSEAAVINRLVEEDRARFLTALEKAVGSSLKTGPDSAKPITDFPDSVTLVARHYDRQLKLSDVARELGLPESPEVANKLGVPHAGELGTVIKVSDGMRRANLGPLATGETIPRVTWEKSFARAARELKLGVPLGF